MEIERHKKLKYLRKFALKLVKPLKDDIYAREQGGKMFWPIRAFVY